MTHQTVCVAEALPAVCALVRPLPRMDLLAAAKSSPVCEALPADVAHERPLARVGPLVPCHIGFGIAGVGAVSTAVPSLLLQVHAPPVLLHEVLRVERFAAYVAVEYRPRRRLAVSVLCCFGAAVAKLYTHPEVRRQLTVTQ